MNLIQIEAQAREGRSLRNKVVLRAISQVLSEICDLYTYIKWHGEIAATSRRLGPVPGPRGPLKA